jgi:hypothetical protein
MTLPYTDTTNQLRSPALTAKGDHRQYVKHSYSDRANEIVETLTESDENTLRLYRKDSVGGTFPIKLQIVLKVVEKLNQEHIISWLPHGRSFMIHRPREFEDEIMCKFFKQTKLTSFQRQLNLYDFQRITHGRDAGSYYHELFLRGRPLLAKRVVRRKVKGTKIRASSSPDDEPNFYTMPPVVPIRSSEVSKSTMSMMNQDQGLYANGANLPPMTSTMNETMGGAPLSALTSASLRNMYDQPSRYPLGNHSSSLQNSSLLSSVRTPLEQSSSLYSDLMQIYGSSRSPMSPTSYGGSLDTLAQTYAGSLDNLNYSRASSALQRNYLGSSYPTQSEELIKAEARYQAGLALLNRHDTSSFDSISRLRGLPPVSSERDPRYSHLNELAIAEESMNSQLFLRLRQQQQQKNSFLKQI